MNFAAQTGARPRIHKQNTKFPKEKSKFRGFLIAKNLDLVYNKKRIVRTLKFRKTEGKDIMRKFIKKILAVSVAAALTAGALSLAGCTVPFVPPKGVPTGDVTSNGGFVVSVGDEATGYYYFINGMADYTANNTYGLPVKGSLMRIKKSDAAKGQNTSQIVVPSILAAGDYTAGIFIYGERVYYATPTAVRNMTGTIESGYLDFKSAKLDGTDVRDVYRTKESNNSMVYRYVEAEGTVYLLYVEGSSTSATIHSLNTATGKDTVIVKNATSYVFDSSDKTNPNVYYTMNVVDRADTEDLATTYAYNQIYRAAANVTEETAPYEYKWDEDWLKENDNEPPYTNLGTIVLDGMSANDSKSQFNHSETKPSTPIGYSYTLRSHANGGLYFTRKQIDGPVDASLYYLGDEGTAAASWDSIKGNDSLTRIADATDTASKATASAFYYTEEKDGTLNHYYLYSTNSNLYRVDVAAGTELEIAYDIGAPTFLGIDATSDSEYRYVYFSRSSGDGLSVERAVYNGTEEDYKDLSYEGKDNKAYRSVKLLDVQHVSGWYPAEILDGNVFYSDAETFDGTSYGTVSFVNIENEDGSLMDNLELTDLNEKFESVTDETDKEKGLFAKLSDVFEDTDLMNAFKYYFYTGEHALFDENIKEAESYEPDEEDLLYTAQERAAFAAFYGNKGYTLESEGETARELFAEGDYSDGSRSYRTYDYFRTRIGKLEESAEESYETYWKTKVLQVYTPETTENEGGLAWWAWLLIALAIAIVAAAAACVTVVFLKKRGKKAEAPKQEKLKVVTEDNRDLDVYAKHPETEPAEAESPAETEASEETSEEAAEEAPAEEPAEAAEAAETPEEAPEEPQN